MRNSNENQSSPGHDPVAAMLDAHRASPEPVELDRIKQRVLAQQPSGRTRPASLRTHLAAVLTVVGLIAGSGGAMAIASGSNGASASFAQYCPSHDLDHGKCERHPPRHCKKHKHSKACRVEKKERKHHHK